MKLISIILSTLLGASPLIASKINDTQAIEQLGFRAQSLHICHQDEWRNLSITIDYESVGIPPHSQEIKDHVRAYLEEYSNPMDFWEVMNTKIIRQLKTKFPQLQYIRSELALKNDKQFYPRSSIVELNEKTNTMKESFTYVRPNYTICNQTFRSLDLYVSFDLKENPLPSDYPDYQWVNNAMEEFFKKQPISTSIWYTLKPQLESHLLEKFPNATSFTVDLKVNS